MKIAVTAAGTGLDSEVDPRFGRCANFIFVDTETDEVEAVANSGMTASGGAGVQAAQLVADKGAEVVLTGNCGPNAYRTLEAAGVKLVVGVSGTVREAIEKQKTGEFESTEGPNVDAKSGVEP